MMKLKIQVKITETNNIADNKWREWKEDSSIAKLKAQTKRKEFRIGKDISRISPEITDQPILKIIHGQVDIKLRQFTE